ncbi:hypothetical protein Q4P03_29195, partial [Burkholderia cepacia]|nr:hypothetical protein [Burkholderia cepacia]
MCQKDGLAELLISALAEASNNLPQLTTLKITTLNFTLSCDAGLPFWTDRLLGALMHDATSQFSHFRLAIVRISAMVINRFGERDQSGRWCCAVNG